MGPPPQACNNLYNATITSALISYPGGSLDPFAHPNATINLHSDQTYNVTLVMLTDNLSVRGNPSPGSIYLSIDYIVYREGVCVDPSTPEASPKLNTTTIGPNQ